MCNEISLFLFDKENKSLQVKYQIMFQQKVEICTVWHPAEHGPVHGPVNVLQQQNKYKTVFKRDCCFIQYV